LFYRKLGKTFEAGVLVDLSMGTKCFARENVVMATFGSTMGQLGADEIGF